MTSASFSGPTLPETTGAIVKRGIGRVGELQPLDADPRSLSHFGLVLLQVLDFGKMFFTCFRKTFELALIFPSPGFRLKQLHSISTRQSEFSSLEFTFWTPSLVWLQNVLGGWGRRGQSAVLWLQLL